MHACLSPMPRILVIRVNISVIPVYIHPFTLPWTALQYTTPYQINILSCPLTYHAGLVPSSFPPLPRYGLPSPLYVVGVPQPGPPPRAAVAGQSQGIRRELWAIAGRATLQSAGHSRTSRSAAFFVARSASDTSASFSSSSSLIRICTRSRMAGGLTRKAIGGSSLYIYECIGITGMTLDGEQEGTLYFSMTVMMSSRCPDPCFRSPTR